MTGMSNIWQSHNLFEKRWVVLSVQQRLRDQFIQEWSTEMNNSPKGLCYRLYKNVFKFEHYLSVLPFNLLITLCKFRCGNNRLPIETGRWRNIPRSERLCHLCASADIGDEYHYIMSCNYFKDERCKYLPQYCNKNINVIKFKQVYSTQNIVELEKLCRFIKSISVKVYPPG